MFGLTSAVQGLGRGYGGGDCSPLPASATARKRNSRLSIRRGRSIVHKNLEDNYGAVITANHEAIAQILEQVSHSSTF